MKSLLKYASIFGLVTLLLVLTGCNRGPRFDVRLDNGQDIAVQADNLQLTNQELFELAAGGYVDWTNPGVSVILDWADYIILSQLFEIDEEMIEMELMFIDTFFEGDSFNNILISQGFVNLDEYIHALRLEMLRHQAAWQAADELILEEDLIELYETSFALEEGEEPEEDRLTKEEHLDVFRTSQINSILSMEGFDQFILSRHRRDAGLTFHSNYFATRYETFLDSWRIDDMELETTRNNDAVASVNGHYLTANEMFYTVIAQFALTGQSRTLNYIDMHLLDAIYDANRNDVRAEINAAKLALMEFFHPQMEALGLLTEQEVFDSFLLGHLQELAFAQHIAVDDSRVQELFDTHIRHREVRHILVEDYETAATFIEELKGADADEMPSLFAELAIEHSICNSSVRGGNLGNLSIPTSMAVEFEEAAFALEEGEFSSTPVETSFGYHIIFVPTIHPALTLEQHYNNELNRLRTTPRYFSAVMFDIRDSQNLRFKHEILQLQYEFVREQVSN